MVSKQKADTADIGDEEPQQNGRLLDRSLLNPGKNRVKEV